MVVTTGSGVWGGGQCAVRMWRPPCLHNWEIVVWGLEVGESKELRKWAPLCPQPQPWCGQTRVKLTCVIGLTSSPGPSMNSSSTPNSSSLAGNSYHRGRMIGTPVWLVCLGVRGVIRCV